ncbi:MAG: hypothetical protein F6J93_26330 [Oscillatoria sp. SIO1A7]|nr:hypothetical protein [Oscillatoria sp. SIO1A7]
MNCKGWHRRSIVILFVTIAIVARYALSLSQCVACLSFIVFDKLLVRIPKYSPRFLALVRIGDEIPCLRHTYPCQLAFISIGLP